MPKAVERMSILLLRMSHQTSRRKSIDLVSWNVCLGFLSQACLWTLKQIRRIVLWMEPKTNVYSQQKWVDCAKVLKTQQESEAPAPVGDIRSPSWPSSAYASLSPQWTKRPHLVPQAPGTGTATESKEPVEDGFTSKLRLGFWWFQGWEVGLYSIQYTHGMCCWQTTFYKSTKHLLSAIPRPARPPCSHNLILQCIFDRIRQSLPPSVHRQWAK